MTIRYKWGKSENGYDWKRFDDCDGKDFQENIWVLNYTTGALYVKKEAWFCEDPVTKETSLNSDYFEVDRDYLVDAHD